MGTGGVSLPIPSKPIEKKEVQFKSSVDLLRDAERYELNLRMNEIRAESETMMKDAKDSVDPNINDHGVGHVQRVLDKTDEVEGTLDEVSLTKQQIGRLQDEREKFDLRCAALMHDVGRTEDLKGQHSVQSGKIINSRTDLFPDIRERERVAKIAILHNKEGSQTFGSDSISELEQKRILTKKEAFQATVLRIADALDVGKKRVEKNTQGEPAHQVIDRIQRTMSPEKAKSYLSHWHGHRGIISAETYNDNGKLGIRIRLDPGLLRSSGTDVAFVAKDVFSDINSTTIGKNYTVDFKCADKNLARSWYRSNQEMFGKETSGVRIVFTQAYD